MSIESISKRIVFLSDLQISVRVTLGNKTKDRNRKDYINIYTFDSDKYNDTSELSSVYINTYEYISLEHIKDIKSSKVLLSLDELYRFRRLLKKAIKWFDDTDLWKRQGKELFIDIREEDKKNKVLVIKNRFDSVIMLTPTVIHNEAKKDAKAIEVLFYNTSMSIAMGKNDFTTFYDIMMNVDLSCIGQQLVNLVESLEKSDIKVEKKGNRS